MITSPPSFASVACLGLGPFFRSVTAGLRLFTVVPTADYQFHRRLLVSVSFPLPGQWVPEIRPLLSTGHCGSVISPPHAGSSWLT